MANVTESTSGNSRQLIALVVLILLAVAGLNFHWEPANTAGTKPDYNELSPPDAVIKQPVLDMFDNTGKKIRQLHGQQMDYFDADKRSVITAPQVWFEQQSNDKPPTPWQITANNATLYESNNRVDLQGNVRLWSDATQGGRSEILTEQLRVDTAKQFAETSKTVTIRARGSEATATGLQADLANERLLLPARVKEIHEVRR